LTGRAASSTPTIKVSDVPMFTRVGSAMSILDAR